MRGPRRGRRLRRLAVATAAVLVLPVGAAPDGLAPGGGVGPAAAQEADDQPPTSALTVDLATPTIEGVPPGWPDPPQVAAPWWLLVDADTGQVLGESRADERRSVASTVKILTALSVVSRVDLDEVVTVGDEVEETVGANVSLEPGDQLTVEQLVVATLVRSGNDAAEALATHVAGDTEAFVELMRQDATALGIDLGDGPDAAALASPSGLGDTNELSAADLALMARAALADPQLRPVLSVSEATLPRVGTDVNRNLLIGEYPGATGVKTGFTEAAGNALVGSASRDGRELVVVLLDAGDDPARFEQATALLDHGFEQLAAVEVTGQRDVLVAGGRRALTVAATTVTVPADAEVVVDLPVAPRVGEGDPARPATLRVDGAEVADLPVAVSGDAPAGVDGAARVGRAAVDGVHAALRATLATR